MNLPYDYTRCANATCPLKDRCWRKTDGHPERQSYSMFTPNQDGTCDNFIEYFYGVPREQTKNG